MTPETKQRIEQIRRGEVPNGYKKTKKGIFPVEWEETTLNKVADIGQGYTFKREYQGQSVGRWNYFKVADIGLKNTGIFLASAINKVDDSLIKQTGCKPFRAGSIVFPRVGAALLNNNKKILLQDSIVDDNVLVLTVKDKFICNNIFLYYLLARLRLEDWCNSGLVPVINSKTVLKQTVNIPPIAEQQKIAAILTTQDKVIALKEKRLAEKQRQKKYLMQQLLTGKKRLPRFSEQWKKVKLGDICVVNPPKEENYPDIVAFLGMADISENGSIITEHKKNYESVKTGFTPFKRGDILIAKITPCFENGKGALTDKCSSAYGFGSTEFHVLRCKAVNSKFLYHHTRTDFFRKRLEAEMVGSAGQKRVQANSIINYAILLPPPIEQTAIAEILSVADREIELIRQEIEQEKEKKKALMQLLLTGIVRVKS